MYAIMPLGARSVAKPMKLVYESVWPMAVLRWSLTVIP